MDTSACLEGRRRSLRFAGCLRALSLCPASQLSPGFETAVACVSCLAVANHAVQPAEKERDSDLCYSRARYNARLITNKGRCARCINTDGLIPYLNQNNLKRMCACLFLWFSRIRQRPVCLPPSYNILQHQRARARACAPSSIHSVLPLASYP